MIKRQFIIDSLDQTDRLARTLAQVFERQGIIGLTGDLGAGKTAFAGYFARALNVVGSVTSPTFTLINEYSLDEKRRLVHADLYRLEGPEAVNLGLGDYFDDQFTICLIEWSDKFPNLMPKDTLWINFTIIDLETERRLITLETGDEKFWPKFEKATMEYYYDR